MRQSIEPTYDRQKTGDRFTVETRIGNRLLHHDNRLVTHERVSDPFINTSVHVGWRDCLYGLLRRELVVNVVVSGDRDIVEDVMELDSDYLGITACTRRKAWDDHLDQALRDFAAVQGEHDSDAESEEGSHWTQSIHARRDNDRL